MKKLYVLVRNDLPWANQAVQAGHAVGEFMNVNPKEWRNEILVYLSVPNEQHLENWFYKLNLKLLSPVKFHEPDLNNSLTAIAVMCPDNVVSKLKLMGAN